MASENCSAIAFYGFLSNGKRKRDFYQRVVKWFDEVGKPADKLSVHAPGYSGKPVSFSRTNSKLCKEGFNTVDSFTIFSTLPECQVPVHDYYLASAYSVRTFESGYAFIVTRSSLSDLNAASMLQLAKDVSTILEPEYGIGYNRMHRLGPGMYAIGVGKGLSTNKDDRQEASRISRWSLEGLRNKVYSQGFLRGVYPLSFLSDKQLNSTVNAQSLREWIEESKVRGSLTKFSDSLTLWEVDKANILEIEVELLKAGRIFK